MPTIIVHHFRWRRHRCLRKVRETPSHFEQGSGGFGNLATRGHRRVKSRPPWAQRGLRSVGFWDDRGGVSSRSARLLGGCCATLLHLVVNLGSRLLLCRERALPRGSERPQFSNHESTRAPGRNRPDPFPSSFLLAPGAFVRYNTVPEKTRLSLSRAASQHSCSPLSDLRLDNQMWMRNGIAFALVCGSQLVLLQSLQSSWFGFA